MMGRMTSACLVALLIAITMVAGSCSGKGSTPPAPDSTKPQPSTSVAAAPPPAPTKTVDFEKLRAQMAPKPKGPTAPVIAPNDYVGLAREFGGVISLVPEAKAVTIQKSELAPVIKLTITNTDSRVVNRLVLKGTYKAGSIYSDEQVITPLKAPAVLAKDGGTLAIEVPFKAKALSPADLAALPKLPPDAVTYEFSVTELGFAN